MGVVYDYASVSFCWWFWLVGLVFGGAVSPVVVVCFECGMC